VSSEAPSPPVSGIQFELPVSDPLAARLFPDLPGTVRWGLERSERILASLGDPHRDYPVLHVGGTNGKGSVARIWAQILGAAGYRTGLYSSPHLVSFRERILVEDRPLPDDLLVDWSGGLRPLLVREEPSYFEAATALALLAFSRAEVDVAVVEVGMGGRLDATNLVDPVLAAVTNVGLEHTAMLGSTLPEIAREKAGIFKPGLSVFTGSQDPEVLEVLEAEAVRSGALLCTVPAPDGEVTLEGSFLRLVTKRWGTLPLQTPLVGRHQLHNLALAVRSLEALPPGLHVSGRDVQEGAERTRIPGRFQVWKEKGQLWILDVAHNLDGMRALRETLRVTDPPRPRVGIVGVLNDKPWRSMLAELAPELDQLILTAPGSAPPERAWDPGVAAGYLSSEHTWIHPDLGSSLGAVRSRRQAFQTVVVTGSSYTVGDCLGRLGRIPAEALPTSFPPG
jgi:dihydrofolate synthase/folylpolyglutamate synthase